MNNVAIKDPVTVVVVDSNDVEVIEPEKYICEDRCINDLLKKCEKNGKLEEANSVHERFMNLHKKYSEIVAERERASRSDNWFDRLNSNPLTLHLKVIAPFAYMMSGNPDPITLAREGKLDEAIALCEAFEYNHGMLEVVESWALGRVCNKAVA